MREIDVLQATIADIWDDLPDLVGHQWPVFEQRLLVLLRSIEGSARPDEYVDAIHALFEEHPAAYERLVDRVAALEPDRVRAVARPAGVRPQRDRYVAVPVLYATDRAAAAGDRPPRRYTGA